MTIQGELITFKLAEADLATLRHILIRLVRADYGMVVIKHMAEAMEFTDHKDSSVDECIDELIERLREEEVLGSDE